MARALRLVGVQLRASLQLAMQYRTDFIVGGLMALFENAWSLAPVLVVYSRRDTVAGWTFPEALLVIAWFTLLKGLLEGAITPSLVATVEHIRKGTLDFVLVKPADAQLLVSTARVAPWHLMDGLTAIAMVAWALRALHHTPSPAGVVVALLLTVASATILYSISILVVAASFWVVRLDNLTYLFESVFDAARWPATVFRGAFRFVFTFVVPLALMTTYPALALLGKLSFGTALFAGLAALAFAVGSRQVWRRAIGHYRSASS
jgi:ABC-2 type transport system permease protein